MRFPSRCGIGVTGIRRDICACSSRPMFSATSPSRSPPSRCFGVEGLESRCFRVEGLEYGIQGVWFGNTLLLVSQGTFFSRLSDETRRTWGLVPEGHGHNLEGLFYMCHLLGTSKVFLDLQTHLVPLALK